MREFAALLRREWLEHRAAFTWGPATVLALIVLAGIMATFVGHQVSVQLGDGDRADLVEKLGTDEVSGLEAFAAMALDVAGSTDAELEAKLDAFLFLIVRPFHLLLLVLVFFALSASLYDERKDHSVLFWKSMPVSDTSTVASKFVFSAWVAPLATIAAICAAQLLALTLASLSVEDGMGSRLWGASGMLLRPVDLVLAYAVMGLWAVPLYGWVMLVSSWANRGPILWSLGAPIVAVILEGVLFGSDWLARVIGGHIGKLTMVYGGGSDDLGGDGLHINVAAAPTLGDRMAELGDLQLWAGMVLGLAFLAVAVHFRRHRNEI
jgi:ABC-2 type transport system permease protein